MFGWITDPFLILCKKVTNHMAGAVVTFFVGGIGILLLADHFLPIVFEDFAGEGDSVVWLMSAGVAMVCIVLSYIADRHRDEARNGVYSFAVVHWIMMAVVFVEVFFIFCGAYDNLQTVLRSTVAAVMAAAITGGTHYLTRPRMD